MTSAVRPSRRRRRNAGQLIVGTLMLLGIVASCFLTFTEDVQLLRVGIVVALWAAIIGAIAMTKYRRESAVDRAKTQDLQTVYELQLDREIAARREYEMTVESRVRGDVREDELVALRAELAALRKNLQLLFDGDIPAERTALRADSTRIAELPSGSPTPPDRHTPAPLFDNHDAPRFASPFDEPVTAETSVVSAERDVPSPAEQTQVIPKITRPVPEPEPDPAPPRQPRLQFVPTDDPESDSGRRRRRADESNGTHSNGRSVAEIMANLQAEATGAGSSDRPRRAQ